MATSDALKQREIEVMTAQINALINHYPQLQERLPLEPSTLVASCRDGVVPAFLAHALCPHLISIGRIHCIFDKPTKNRFWMLENWETVLQAARRLGCRLVNVGGHDLLEGKEALLIGLLWQLMKQGMVAAVVGTDRMEEASSRSSTPTNSAGLSKAETRLLEWINERLQLEGTERVQNLGDDLADGSVYARLLNELAPKGGEDDPFLLIMAEDDFERRAELIVGEGRRLLGEMCSLEAADIITGNERLNLFFLGSLIRAIMLQREDPALEVPTMAPSPTPSQPPNGMMLEIKKEEALREKEEMLREKEETLREKDKIIEQLESELACLRLSLHSAPVADLMVASEQMPRECRRLAQLQHDSACLRTIYKAIDDPVRLAEVLYGGDITWNHLADGAVLTGTLSKRGDLRTSNWRPRICLVRDNFLCYWEPDRQFKEQPAKAVIRLDDAQVELIDEPSGTEIQAQIMIRVNSLSPRKREVFFGGSKATIQEWFRVISKTISWFDRDY